MPPNQEQQTQAQPQIDSVSQGTKLLVAEHRPLVRVLWTVAIVLAVAIFYYVYAIRGDQNMISFSQNDGTILLLLLPFVIPLGYRTYLSGKARKEMVEQIAQSFGYSYASSASFDSISGAAIFSRGQGRRLYDVMTGMYREYPVRMFSYQYTVQQGKHSETYHDTVCELTYPTPLPHIVILPHAPLGLPSMDVGFFSGLGALEKAQLEGDFGSQFDVYVEKDAQLQLREILEPDIMQMLMQVFKGYDMEIKDSKIYMLQHGSFSTRAQYLVFHQLADSLIDKLIPGLRSAGQDSVSVAPNAAIQ